MDKPFRFFILRVILYIVLLFITVTIAFLLVRMMPGSPLDYLSGEASDIPYILTEEVKKKLLEYYGLNKPLWQQYLVFIAKLLHLNLGYSIYFSEPVIDILTPHLIRTLVLVIIGFTLSILISLPLSMLSAWRRGGILDTTTTFFSMIIYSIPSFALAILFLIIFSIKIRVFPVVGFSTEENFQNLLWYALAPAIVFAFAESGRIYYFMRNAFVNELDEDYILFARAKGLKDRTLILRHLLRGALSPIISKLALSFGYSFLTCMFVEKVFSYPGLTWLLLTAYDYYDYPILENVFLAFMLIIIVMNAIADILSFMIDPRMRGVES